MEKEPKTCHQCELEAIDDCQTENKHIPDDENLLPCVCCVRNYLNHKPTNWRADFYAQTWYSEADKSAAIDDPDPHEKTLLETLHLIIMEVRA
jgi:hypothetical protein